MKIILVVTDAKGKNLVFSTNVLRVYSLDESIKLAKEGKLESVHAVKTSQGSYLRTNPNEVGEDNLDSLSISANHLYLSLDDFTCLLSGKKKFKACKNHLELHFGMIEERGEHVIYVEEHPLITREQVMKKLAPHRKLIIAAAKQFSIDPYTLGAIIIDEIARANPWEEALDRLGAVFVGSNASVGIAQVTMDTAINVIRAGYYNPNPDDKKISPERIAKTSMAYLYAYVIQPRHNIRFAAARVRQTIDYWAHKTDLTDRPGILGTLYSQGLGDPRPNPGASDRGLQIAREFYPLAKIILEQSAFAPAGASADEELGCRRTAREGNGLFPRSLLRKEESRACSGVHTSDS